MRLVLKSAVQEGLPIVGATRIELSQDGKSWNNKGSYTSTPVRSILDVRVEGDWVFALVLTASGARHQTAFKFK